MYRTALVDIVPRYAGVFNHLDCCRLPWLLVVLNPVICQAIFQPAFELTSTHESAILRFTPPGIACLRCVKNSVLK